MQQVLSPVPLLVWKPAVVPTPALVWRLAPVLVLVPAQALALVQLLALEPDRKPLGLHPRKATRLRSELVLAHSQLEQPLAAVLELAKM